MNSTHKYLKSGAMIIVSLLFYTQHVFSQATSLKNGSWRGTFQLNDSTQLPFIFVVSGSSHQPLVEIINGTERIKVDEITLKNDSVFISMPVFDSEFRVQMTGDSLMKGLWINHARKTNNTIAFNAKSGESRRFMVSNVKSPATQERLKVIFEPHTKDEYFSVGTFTIENGIAKGTFATETGDYRYLEGYSTKDKFMVSCFDGAHAFLFSGKIKGDSIVNGNFYSGAHGHETWIAHKDNQFELRNPDSLTFLKPGYTKIDFNFKNLEGKNISLKDERYKNKVVLIQIMGTWCPNCMDETKFLASFYDQFKPKGLEVIGLAFERTEDFTKAVSNVQRLKTRFNAKYEFLITMKNGSTAQASEALPMLNSIMAFPTTIYIDKKGIVRKIYTGFYGPATGDNYTKYVEQTTRFIEKLLAE